MASQSLTETSAGQSREAHGICPSDRAPAGMPRRFHDHDVMGGVKRPRPQETDAKGQALPAPKKQARANTREAAAASSSSAPTAKETESADQRPFVTRAAPVPQSMTLAEPLRYLTEADRITGIADGQLRYFRFAGAQVLSHSDRTQQGLRSAYRGTTLPWLTRILQEGTFKPSGNRAESMAYLSPHYDVARFYPELDANTWTWCTFP